MRGIGARLRERFGGVEVRSQLALVVGLVLAGMMILVVAVATAVAVARLVT